jgi:DNA-directed RNA polymerase specialized sigma subunit
MKKQLKEPPKNKGSRRRKKEHYFTKVHQDAIVEYARTKDIKIRTKLYIKYICPVFDEMVDKIVYTYKFTNLPNVDDLKDECKIWLTTILDKFDPDKGSKAFSYFSVITKNWFIHKVKKNSTKTRRELQLDGLKNDLVCEYLSDHNNYYQLRNEREFWQSLFEKIGSWEKENLKANERKVLDAVKILFENSDDIEIFNKKAIYLYLREITGLNTKQVVNNLNKLRNRYKEFKKEWNKN